MVLAEEPQIKLQIEPWKILIIYLKNKLDEDF